MIAEKWTVEPVWDQDAQMAYRMANCYVVVVSDGTNSVKVHVPFELDHPDELWRWADAIVWIVRSR